MFDHYQDLARWVGSAAVDGATTATCWGIRWVEDRGMLSAAAVAAAAALALEFAILAAFGMGGEPWRA